MEVASPPPLPFPATRRAVWKRVPPYALLACVLIVALSPRFIFVKQSEWQQVYVDTARQFRDGGGLYGPGQPYVYPPFMAAAALPFSLVPETVSRTAWLLINALALVIAVRAAWRLAGGDSRLPNFEAPRSEHWIFWLGLACGGYYVIDSLGHQQTDLVIAALVFAGCLAIREERSLFGGILLGVAAGCKCTPLLFAPYLIWRGRWLASLALVAAAIGVNLLPDLTQRAPEGGLWLTKWWNTYIAPQMRGDLLPGVWASEVIYNQSLSGALNRWTQTTWSWDASGVVVSPSPALSAADLKQLVRLAQLGVGLAALMVFLHRPFRSIRLNSEEASKLRFGLECGIVMILMLLFSPMSSKPHFCTLLLPGFAVARVMMSGKKSRGLAVVVGAAILCGLLANKDLVKARIYTLVLWYGLVTFSAILLGIACGIAIVRSDRTQATGLEETGAAERRSAPRVAA